MSAAVYAFLFPEGESHLISSYSSGHIFIPIFWFVWQLIPCLSTAFKKLFDLCASKEKTNCLVFGSSSFSASIFASSINLYLADCDVLAHSFLVAAIAPNLPIT